MNTGICELCRCEKPLLKKSHIIPKWMHFGLYDANNKVAEINLRTGNRPKFQYGALYDQHILCQDCDNVLLSVLENYAKSVLCKNDTFHDFINLAVPGMTNVELPVATLQLKDYTKFKLFWLSILWRMHVSTRPFFQNVDLGEKHAERMRTGILSGQIFPADEYPISIMCPENVPDTIFNMIGTPRRVRYERSTYYVQLINGLFIMINISSIDVISLIAKTYLKDNGVFKVYVFRGQIAKLFYDSLYTERNSSSKSRRR